MKRLLVFISASFGLIQIATATSDQPLLARVTAYWRAEGCGLRASSTGAPLRNGNCAVDPKKIPFGSQIVFDDVTGLAVDTGPDVVNRKAARACGRNIAEKNAIVIDRFFETKAEAMSWLAFHPHFVKVWVVPPGVKRRTASISGNAERTRLELNLGKNISDGLSLTTKPKRG